MQANYRSRGNINHHFLLRQCFCSSNCVEIDQYQNSPPVGFCGSYSNRTPQADHGDLIASSSDVVCIRVPVLTLFMMVHAVAARKFPDGYMIIYEALDGNINRYPHDLNAMLWLVI